MAQAAVTSRSVPFQRWLTLSGERPKEIDLQGIQGVGLVRGEYLFREFEQFPTFNSALQIVDPYLSELSEHLPERPIWYRTTDLTVAEANVLEGVDMLYRRPPYDFMSLRGIRRAMLHPAPLLAELHAIERVRRTNPQLGVIAPFVTNRKEVEWFVRVVAENVGDNCPVGCMIETPAAALSLKDILQVSAVSNIVVGCNDLTSLMYARPRRRGETIPLTPALDNVLLMCAREASRQGTSVGIAGYVDSAVIARAAELDMDYSSLPPDNFAVRDHISRIKQLTSQRIDQHSVEWTNLPNVPEYPVI